MPVEVNEGVPDINEGGERWRAPIAEAHCRPLSSQIVLVTGSVLSAPTRRCLASLSSLAEI